MKNKLKILSIVLIIAILFTYTHIYATNNEKDLQNEKTEIKNSISEAEDKLENVKEEKSNTLNQVESLINQISNYKSEIDELDTQVTNLELKIKEDEQQIKQDEEQYLKQKSALGERLITIYENGNISYLDVLLASNSLTDFISSYYIVSELITYDTEMLKQVEEKKQKIENEKQELENNKESLNIARKTKESKVNALKIAKVEKEEKANQLVEDEKSIINLISELKEHESNIDAKIKQMQKEYDEQLKKQQSDNMVTQSNKKTNSNNKTNTTQISNNNSSKYGFGWPVNNPNITTGYGISGKYWSSGHHTGIDFKASKGTPVYSIGNGKVFDTGYSSAYGNFIEIYHGNNIYSFYAHASNIQVSVGQTISKGQQIMLSGDSGNVTGPHLHFEVRSPSYRYANCVNPTSYLP